MPRPRVRLASVRPGRPWYHPDSVASVELGFRAVAATPVRVALELLDLDQIVARGEAAFRLPAGTSTRMMHLPLPAMRRHGYGLRAVVRWNDDAAGATGEPGAIGASAVEALDGWWESPRHAAITEFRSPARSAAAIKGLRDWHVTVVQLYDWMYRHYRYAPASGASTFLDALGRRVSHDAMRAGVRAGHAAGIASLAYGSVYGAEREYVDAHPDERVFGDDGEPLSLGETFYINDLRPGQPWRTRLLAEYARAVRDFAVDGIHMDTYGPPHRAVGHDGEPIDFAALYPGLIADGATAVAAAREGARVLFNCVEGFPLEHVAIAGTAATYLELWPPDVAYVDIVRWIERARTLGDGRAVVIAAYISALREFEADPVRRPGAVEAAVLLTSVIAAAGAYHHVLAEGDRLLVEGYYPEARRLRVGERRELRAAWEFGARYVHLLSDPGLVPDPGRAARVELADATGQPVAVSAEPRAGAVWVHATHGPSGTRVLHLLDLIEQSDDRWDDVRQPSPRRSGWGLRWSGAVPTGLVAMSPWSDAGAARRLDHGPIDETWRLPPFRRWLVLTRPQS